MINFDFRRGQREGPCMHPIQGQGYSHIEIIDVVGIKEKYPPDFRLKSMGCYEKYSPKCLTICTLCNFYWSVNVLKHMRTFKYHMSLRGEGDLAKSSYNFI